MGIDYGERRIGLAVSDPTGVLATPIDTIIRRKGKRPPLARMERVAREREVEMLVVGLPLTLEGQENEWCEEVRAFGDALAKRLEVPVAYVDERFSSVRAEQAIRSIGLSKRDREDKARVDAAAAAIILQSWLDGDAGR
jgi:putative Holliday junction resolvase